MSAECNKTIPQIDPMVIKYPYEIIRDATNNFEDKNFLGSGTYGKVYSGELYGTKIAVKAFSIPIILDFIDEVSALSKYRHPNLVTLMGYAYHRSNFYLIFELLPSDLKSKLLSGKFKWEERVRIILDTALGMSYLYNIIPKCFHRDLKPENILISESGSAKVADFGLARFAHHTYKSVNFGVFSGTAAYADPIYKRTKIFSEASEVYSFGTILLELLTGISPIFKSSDGKTRSLVKSLNYEDIKLLGFLDSTANFPQKIALFLGKLAFQCTNNNPKKRPDFLTVTKELRSLTYSKPTNTEIKSLSLPIHDNEEKSESLSEIDKLECKSEDLEELMLNLSLQLSLDLENHRIYQTKEDERELLAGIEASRRDYELEKFREF